MEIRCEIAENIEGKGEIVVNQNVFFFFQCFRKLFASELLKHGIVQKSVRKWLLRIWLKNVVYLVLSLRTLVKWYLLGRETMNWTFLTFSQTIPDFYVSALHVFWKHCWKRRNCASEAISPFPTVFSTGFENFLPFSSNVKLSSAISFELEELVYNLPFRKKWRRKSSPNSVISRLFQPKDVTR